MAWKRSRVRISPGPPKFLKHLAPTSRPEVRAPESLNWYSGLLLSPSTAVAIQVWPIERLVHYARNPRKNDGVVDRMCSNIREFGFKIPVLARTEGEGVDGHRRLKAVRKLGIAEIPAVPCDEWTPWPKQRLAGNGILFTVRKTVTNKRFAFLAVVGLIALAQIHAADVSDKVTGLPVHPGLRMDMETDSPVCGKDANMGLYSPPRTSSETFAEYIAWYKAQLKGFHYVHKNWGDRAQDMFYSPDGATGVGISGMPKGPGVYAVTYMKFAVKLTTHRMEAFDPSNPTCK